MSEEDEQGHEHTPACAAYYDERGWWAKVRHFPAWRNTVEERRRRTLVQHGMGSVEHRRMRLRAAVWYLLCLAQLYVAVLWAEGIWQFAAWAWVLVFMSNTLRGGAWRHTRAASDYCDGWLEGRQQLIQSTFLRATEFEQVDENGGVARVDLEKVMAGLAFETTRDMEVVLDVRTAKAPDDLSGLGD